MSVFGKREIGDLGETAAAKYLKKHGCRIVGRNVRFGRNELDIVARDGDCIAFVEVKTRTFETAAEAEEADARPSLAVGFDKRRRTLTAARDYLRAHPTPLCPRMDVVEVTYLRGRRPKLLKILHIPAAFDARGAAN